MPDGNDYSELNPRIEVAKLPIKMAAETIAKEKDKPNQDSHFANAGHKVAGVLDGMGGHKGGAEASEIGKSMETTLLSKTPTSVEDAKVNIMTAFSIAQENILYNARKPELTGMGTTGTIMQLVNNNDGTQTAVIGNVGDSRAYIFRDGKLETVTIDDNDFTKRLPYEKAKAIQARLSNIVINNSAEATEYFSLRNRIGSALGSKDGITPNIYTVKLKPGDRLILTTDGVHDNLTDRDIEAVMRAKSDPGEAVRRLTENAKTISEMGKEVYVRSKRDDITAIVVEIGNSTVSKQTILPKSLRRDIKPSQAPVEDNLGRIQDVREKITDIREAQSNLFDDARSANEVLSMLAGIDGIQGSKDWFSNRDLIDLSRQVFTGKAPLTMLPRTHGLRLKVEELLSRKTERQTA